MMAKWTGGMFMTYRSLRWNDTVSATVAASLTKAVGLAWSRVCEYAVSLPADQRDRFLESGEVTEKFVCFMKAGGVASALGGLGRKGRQ